MGKLALENSIEQVVSLQKEALWGRRSLELEKWAEREKVKKRDKLTMVLESFAVDAQLYPALALMRRLQIPTQFSCAGVSLKDDPLDHSLYAYVTILESEQTEQFVRFASQYMKHRVLITYEPERSRYDLSSFFIGHNRSFCLLLHRCTKAYEEHANVQG
ncbi:hypothetical protein [Paenibacillus sinopodophylli]|uniref:hypothetical protein n=1 Tax=Paenibacillus sinopodophylli TaxID=1837342 RepID=UPI001FE2BD5D|nr:hypothetical protein [Paenibacillus sinopodophylli]